MTFKLAGATFGQAVDWIDISADDDDDSENESMFKKVGGSQKDGRRGDSSVTLRVTTTVAIEGDDDSGPQDFMKQALDTGRYIRFNLGSVQGYAGAGSVTASAEFRVTDGPDANFPTEVVAREAVMAVMGDDTATPPINAVVGVIGTSNMVATSASAVTFTPANGGTGNIDLDNRATLAAGATQVAVGGVSYMTNTMAVEADGMTVFATGKGAEADIHITVSGMVRDTDTVYFDIAGGDGKAGVMDDKEGLTIADGVATGSFRLTAGTVYFVPDGETNMTAGSLTASFAPEYDATSVVDPTAVMGGAKLVYNGVGMQARAYAIPNPEHPDMGNVRIKCEASGDSTCTVFLDCNEQDGMARFGELSEPIAAGATAHLNEGAIGDVLGIDTWSGRLSCDVLSASSVSVQVLVRSGDALVNNTFVDGGG